MLDHKRQLFNLIKYIREYFSSQDFIDVMPPIAVPHPGYETHIHPFALYSMKEKKKVDLYLNTSPEYYMKELLSEGAEKIFTVNYSFRDEPNSPIHRNQFLMLEWYRINVDYSQIATDVKNLLNYCAKKFNKPVFNFIEFTVDELFQKYCNFSILDFLDKSTLRKKIENDLPRITLPNENDCEWDDYFFLIFLNIIEPELEKLGAVIVKEYPYHLSALSELKQEDNRVCKRFEVYIDGIELGNCFQELTDIKIQKNRHQSESAKKRDLYHYELGEPHVLFDSLQKGIPRSAGIAMGVERILKSIYRESRVFYA